MMAAEILASLQAHWLRILPEHGFAVADNLWASLKESTKDNYARAVLKWLCFCREHAFDARKPTAAMLAHFV